MLYTPTTERLKTLKEHFDPQDWVDEPFCSKRLSTCQGAYVQEGMEIEELIYMFRLTCPFEVSWPKPKIPKSQGGMMPHIRIFNIVPRNWCSENLKGYWCQMNTGAYWKMSTNYPSDNPLAWIGPHEGYWFQYEQDALWFALHWRGK